MSRPAAHRTELVRTDAGTGGGESTLSSARTSLTVAELGLAGYDVERVVGRGGMGTVYLARHRKLGREVAVKALSPVLSQDPVAMARFDNEMVTMAGLDCPSIARIHDGSVTPSGVPYFVMDFIDGPSLAEVIEAADGPFTVAETVDILRPIAEALDYLHDSNVRDPIVHRDVKPENILLAETGAVLTDFGISYIAQDTRLTVEGIVVGTGMYMAPELYEPGTTAATPATDNYALALIAYEMLTGTPFYRTMSPEAWRGPRPTAQLEGTIFANALANDPVDRYPNAKSFINALSLIDATSDPHPLSSLPAHRTGFSESSGSPRSSRAASLLPFSSRPGSSRARSALVFALAGCLAAVTSAVALSLTESDWVGGERRIAETFPELVSDGNGGTGWLGARCTTGVREMGQQGKIACSSSSVTFSIADYGTAEERSSSVDWPEESNFTPTRCFSKSDVTPMSAQVEKTPPRFAVLPAAPNDGFAVLIGGDKAEELIADIPVCPRS